MVCSVGCQSRDTSQPRWLVIGSYSLFSTQTKLIMRSDRQPISWKRTPPRRRIVSLEGILKHVQHYQIRVNKHIILLIWKVTKENLQSSVLFESSSHSQCALFQAVRTLRWRFRYEAPGWVILIYQPHTTSESVVEFSQQDENYFLCTSTQFCFQV